MRSINSLGAHSPKTEWLEAFFQGKDDFFNENALAAPQLLKFKLFLHDAGLIDKVHLTALFSKAGGACECKAVFLRSCDP